MLQDFTSALRTQIDAIEQALPSAAPTESPSSKSFDPIAASREIGHLRSQLEASSGDSEETFRTVQSVLTGHVEKSQLNALSADISDFNFAEALLKLDDIVREHHLDREEVKG